MLTQGCLSDIESSLLTSSIFFFRDPEAFLGGSKASCSCFLSELLTRKSERWERARGLMFYEHQIRSYVMVMEY